MQAGGTKTYAHLALHMDEELWLVALGARMDKLPHLVRRLVCKRCRLVDDLVKAV